MKRLVVIGASSGIGRRVATDFAKMGWEVAVAARREDRLKEIADNFPGKVVYKAIDVTSPDCVERFNDLIEMNGGMDMLLFASGVGFANPDLAPGLDESIMAVNVLGFTRIINAAYKYFKRTAVDAKGRICAITSIAGTKGMGAAPTYSATKRYQQNYLQAISQLAHMQRVNVSVTDIRPGFIRTDLLDPNKSYPLIMAVNYVAPLIEKAMLRGSRVAYIDWRWGLVTSAWKLIPRFIWERMSVQ